MAVLNPDHLFDQAEKLIAAPAAGPPRQVDLRRAVSTAYYAVFHYILTAAADEFIGVTKRNTALYTLVYRSVDHRGLKELAQEVRKPQPTAKYSKYVPAKGFGNNIQAFAVAVVELQEKRHVADYDPSARMKTSDASAVVATARSAIRRFEKATAARRKAFLALMLFPPR